MAGLSLTAKQVSHSLLKMAVRTAVVTIGTCFTMAAVMTLVFMHINKSPISHLLNIFKHEIVGSYDNKYEEYFPKHYHASGLLILPYDKIMEPFEAWFAGDKNMSRIDYYYGMDKTIQRGDIGSHGTLLKIVPMHSDMAPSDNDYISCWYKPVPRWMPSVGQSVIPTNLSEFQLVGEEIHRGLSCLKFVRKFTKFNKTNEYTFYITKSKPHRPLRYEMIGYDDLLTSHYDHYILDYITFEPWKFNMSLFSFPQKTWCAEKAKKINSPYIMNPMSEYMHFNHAKDRQTDKSYDRFKKKHNKHYDSKSEHERRKHIFKHNVRFINSKNRQHLKFKLNANHFADMTDKELKAQNGLLHEEGARNHTREMNISHSSRDVTLPCSLDWRDYGAVTPVKSQGICGSCWTFSTLGTIEGAHFLQTGKLEELSKQQLLDCSWAYGNNGCRGGFQDRTLKWIRRNGVAFTRDYGPYLAQEGFCHCGKKEKCAVARIEGFMRVKKHYPKALKFALVTHGPIAASVNADPKTFRFYSNGVYDDPLCKTKTNHAVVAIGYGEEKGEPYWLIKNSWGHLWGDQGYIKIAIREDVCGVTNGPMIAIIKPKTVPEFPLEHLNKTRKHKVENSEEEKRFLSFFPF